MSMQIPPAGSQGPTKLPESKKEKSSAESEYEKALPNLKKGETDSGMLKSRNFRELSGEASFFDKIAILWEKFTSFLSPNPVKHVDDIEEDLAYRRLSTAEKDLSEIADEAEGIKSFQATEFRKQIENIKGEMQSNPTYSSTKSERKWEMLTQVKYQLSRELELAEADASDYENGQTENLNNDRLANVKALVTKYNDAVKEYNS